MTRATIGQDSACFSYVDPVEWEQDLQGDQANAQVMAEIKTQQLKVRDRSATGYGAVTLVGEFDVMADAEPTKWHDVLVGVAAAQQVSKGAILVTFVYSDLEGKDGPEAAELLDLYLRRDESPWGSSVAAVDLGIASSRVVHWERNRTTVVATRDEHFSARVKEQVDRAARGWLDRTDLAPAADALVDDVEADLCTDLRAARKLSASFDMRRAQLTPKLLNDMAACGGASVLVEPEDVPALTTLPNRPREVKIHYVNDRSGTITPDCRRVLGTNPSADSLKACVAVVAANESFRVAVEQLPDQETP